MPITFDHTRIRVSNLEKSIDWYCRTCGFEVLKRTDKSPSGNQLAHLQIPGSAHNLELTYSPDYAVKVPEDLVHTCIRVDDIVAYCKMLEGLDLTLDLWPSNWREKFKDGKKMAFITDPGGYEVEILEHSWATSIGKIRTPTPAEAMIELGGSPGSASPFVANNFVEWHSSETACIGYGAWWTLPVSKRRRPG